VRTEKLGTLLQTSRDLETRGRPLQAGKGRQAGVWGAGVAVGSTHPGGVAGIRGAACARGPSGVSEPGGAAGGGGAGGRDARPPSPARARPPAPPGGH
jgi:hypothetical protein